MNIDKYPTQSGKRLALSLHYNRSNSFLFVIATKIYHFKHKNADIENYTLCSGNISKDFTIINLKEKKNSIKSVNFFSVDFNPIDANEILDMHKYLMKWT